MIFLFSVQIAEALQKNPLINMPRIESRFLDFHLPIVSKYMKPWKFCFLFVFNLLLESYNLKKLWQFDLSWKEGKFLHLKKSSFSNPLSICLQKHSL